MKAPMRLKSHFNWWFFKPVSRIESYEDHRSEGVSTYKAVEKKKPKKIQA